MATPSVASSVAGSLRCDPRPIPEYLREQTRKYRGSTAWLRRHALDHSTHEVGTSGDLSWILVYTKAHAEAWADINLRSQGFETLIPRVAARGGFRPLFPRYVFVGAAPDLRTRPVWSTLGVLYVVHCGERPAAVPLQVIDEIRGRMNEHGVVHLERKAAPDELFARRERDRVRALIKLSAAGFRVRSA